MALYPTTRVGAILKKQQHIHYQIFVNKKKILQITRNNFWLKHNKNSLWPFE